MVGNDISKRLTLNFDTSKALQAPQMNITRRAKLSIIYNHNTILSGNIADTFPLFLNAKKDQMYFQLRNREQGDPNMDNHEPNPCTGPSTFFPLRFESWPRTWRSRQGQGGGRDVLERSCQVLQTDQRVLLHNCVPLPAWSPCLDNTAPWRSTSTRSTTCTSSSWATATVP